MSMGRDALWLTFSKIATTIINLIVTMLLSRFRTLEEYGTYSQIILVNMIVVSVFSMGLPNCINYFLNRSTKAEDRQKFISTYFTGGTFLSVVVALVLLVCYPLIVSYFKNEALFDYKFAVLILPWVTLFNNSVENIYISYQKIRWMIYYRISYAVALLGIVGLFVLFGGNFHTYMIAFCGLQVLFVFILYVSVYLLIEKRSMFSFDWGLTKEILTYGIPLALSLIVTTLNIELDKLMVARLYSTEEMAIYTNVSKELPLNLLSVSIATILLPKMVRYISAKKEETAMKMWGVSIRLSSLIIVFACMLLVVFAEPVVSILYSDKYLPGTNIFRVYSLTSLVKITTWGIVLNSTKKTKTILGISVITLVSNVILNFILLPTIGMIGAAIATMISEFLTILLKLYFTSKNMNIKFRAVVPWAKIFAILAYVSVFGLIAHVIFSAFKMNFSSIMSAVFAGAIIIVAYVATVFKPAKKLWSEFNTY